MGSSEAETGAAKAGLFAEVNEHHRSDETLQRMLVELVVTTNSLWTWKQEQQSSSSRNNGRGGAAAGSMGVRSSCCRPDPRRYLRR